MSPFGRSRGDEGRRQRPAFDGLREGLLEAGESRKVRRPAASSSVIGPSVSSETPSTVSSRQARPRRPSRVMTPGMSGPREA